MACISSATPTEAKDPLSPEDKPFSWFLSEEGQRVYDLTMGVQNLENDILYEKEQKEKDIEYFSVYVHVYRKGFKSPRIYLESLVTVLGKEPGCSDALLYVFPIEAVAGILKILAKPYYTDDNGDPVVVEPKPDGKFICDPNKNPVLKFARDFNAYQFGSDLDWKGMVALWHDAIYFVAHEVIDEHLDVLEKNPWLLEKSTYITSAGTLRTEKGFLSTGAEKATNKKYFQEHLADLDE